MIAEGQIRTDFGAADSLININMATLTANLNNEINTRTILSASLTTEIARAQAAEAQINTNLASLLVNMATLTANINNEINARTNLSANLVIEVNRAQAAEASINNTANLNNEINTRTILSASVTTEIARAQAAEAQINTNLASLLVNMATLTANINNEINARTNLSANLVIEVNRAQAAEASINNTVNTEITRAKMAETIITSATSSIPSGFAGTLEYWMDCNINQNEPIGSTPAAVNSGKSPLVLGFFFIVLG